MGRRRLRLHPARVDERPSQVSAGLDSADLDTDDYGSFDEEELEILNNLLQVHSFPARQAANVLPHPQPISSLYPTLPTLLTDNPPGPISASPTTFKPVISQSFEPSEGQFDDPEDDEDAGDVPSEHELQKPISRIKDSQSLRKDDPFLTVQYEGTQSGTTEKDNQTPESPPPPIPTDQPPFSRFRGPKRGLSVTDLLSNTWCEQQFEYYLVKGKKRTTPAMRRGTAIHKKLEEEVHETIEIKIDTPQERLAMQLLNIIQGLRTLREIGKTREFPVFAFVKGLFVQGVIDEISYTRPVDKVYSIQEEGSNSENNDSEDQASPPTPMKRRGAKKKSAVVAEDQPLITNFTRSTSSKAPEVAAYLSDHKTRLRNSLPTPSQFRGTELQLMLYHHLLTTMASSAKVSAETFSTSGILASTALPGNDLFSQLFALRNLDPYARLEDSFLARITPLLDESDLEIDSDSTHSLTAPTIIRFPTLTHITDNPTLSGLVKLLDMSFSLSLPNLSNILSVSYQSQQNSRLLATKVVEYNQTRMEGHLMNVLRWWQGERGTVGVPIEEAWKCRSCEFADECEWRLKKLAELQDEREAKKGKNIGKGKQKV